ncbi:MAG TPA: hypothetical protein VFC29_11990, partial [Candidatus Limnocylindrales bacterium]|nr:hypothetical protein [Candidatus Limnocylindrales bacterium]
MVSVEWQEESLPLIPGEIPNPVQGCSIKPELEFPATVTAHRRIVVTITFPERNVRPALPAIRQEADNPTIKECLSITGGRALGCLGNDWLSGTGSNAVADVVFRK